MFDTLYTICMQYMLYTLITLYTIHLQFIICFIGYAIYIIYAVYAICANIYAMQSLYISIASAFASAFATLPPSSSCAMQPLHLLV